jgi:hypothetical protein
MSYFLDFGDFDLSYLVDLNLRVGIEESSVTFNAHTAKTAGMRAVLLRSQAGSTTALAQAAAQAVNGLIVMGAFSASEPAHLNPAIVEAALAEGAKLVAASRAALFTANGELRGEVNTVLELVRAGGVVLSTGELSEEKTILLVQAAKELGVTRILVPAERWRAIVQNELLAEGVFFEWTLTNLQYPADPVQIAAMADGMRQAGIEASVISTGIEPDRNLESVEALSHYLAALTAQRLSVRDLKQMAKKAPAFLLDLPERFPRKPDK